MHCKWIIVKITNVSKIRQPKISVKECFTLILGCLLNLVNKSVSRETSMLAANRLTQIGNERMSGECLLPALAQRTSACLSASLWTASSSTRQTVQLSVSISTTATKHLPDLRT